MGRETFASRRAVLVAAKSLLASVSVLAALGMTELALRASHFQFRAIPEVQFGWPEPEVIQNEFQPDPDILWVTRDYQMKLARARAESARVIFMGDSCVEFSTYPLRTLQRLGQVDPELSVGEKFGV